MKRTHVRHNFLSGRKWSREDIWWLYSSVQFGCSDISRPACCAATVLCYECTVLWRNTNTFCWTKCIASHSMSPRGFTFMCGGDITVYVLDINQPSLPIPCYSVLVSVSVLTALSTVFHNTHSSDNASLSHSVLSVLFQPYRPFQLYIFMKVSLNPDIIIYGWLGLKH